MKLGLPVLGMKQKLSEFDKWITSTLCEIKDSEKFQTEINAIVNAIEVLGTRTEYFENIYSCTPDKIAESVIFHIKGKDKQNQVEMILGLISFLFMVTGKSDNNCKCQFPVYLKNEIGITSVLKQKNTKGKNHLSEEKLPRVINDSTVATITVSLENYPLEQLSFLSKYISFLLNEEIYHNSLWALGKTYFTLKKEEAHLAFLLPLVVYRVRGSVSASGGHEPENILRELLLEWGLFSNIGYNYTDVIVGHEESEIKAKTRAYDFVLPYNIEGWNQRLFIQSQFYAGDSGSVSHKNVDQIKTSRSHIKTHIENPVFIEYVDGAGYFGSLNGDLKKILEMQDTHDFFQVRTSIVKLRNHLQNIGFLLPIELYQEILLGNNNLQSISSVLHISGYSKNEISRAILFCIDHELLTDENGTYHIPNNKVSDALKYLLLDLIVVNAKNIDAHRNGCFFIPGKGDDMGIDLLELGNLINEDSRLKNLFGDSTLLLNIIQNLVDKGFLITR